LGDGSVGQIAEFVDTVRRRARVRLGQEIYVMINHAGFDHLDILRTELRLQQGSGCVAAPPPGGRPGVSAPKI
jgi:hypothetical protein